MSLKYLHAVVLRNPPLSDTLHSCAARKEAQEEEKQKERAGSEQRCVYARMRERRRDEKSDNSPATLRPLAALRVPYRSPDTCLSRKLGPTNWPL